MLSNAQLVPLHRGWIEGCRKYGKRVFERIKDKPRICAGTIAGGTAAAEHFLARFTAEMERTDFCNDQGGAVEVTGKSSLPIA